jgi:hypothetical protein
MSNDLTSLLKALQTLSEGEWVDDVLRDRVDDLNADMEQTQETISTETEFSNATLRGRWGRKTPAVQGLNFGRDTGWLQDDWLKNVEIKNGEVTRYLDLPYAVEQQEIVAKKSPFPDGYLHVSDQVIDDLLEAIADKAEKILAGTI